MSKYKKAIAGHPNHPDDYRWKQAHQCFWCNRVVRYTLKPVPSQATRDHLKPRKLGGKNTHSNIVVACKACNSRRGHDLEWRPGTVSTIANSLR